LLDVDDMGCLQNDSIELLWLQCDILAFVNLIALDDLICLDRIAGPGVDFQIF
jgi:hypothetical protein